MKNTLGVITNKPRSNILSDLTMHRSINTVPFGGRYRLIDFALSNMVNAGIKRIGVIGSNKYRSLVEHLGTGQEWSLSRKNQGLMILDSGINFQFDKIPKINLQDFTANKSYFQQVGQEHILISESDLICKINYQDVIESHIKSGADITFVCKKLEEQCLDCSDVKVRIDKHSDKISEIGDFDNGNCNYLFLDMLIIKKELLLSIISRSDELGGPWDLIEVIGKNIDRLNVKPYIFEGYYYKVNSVEKYYKCSMDLLKEEVKQELFLGDDKIYTKVDDNHPTRYLNTSYTNNSLVASGCVLNGEIRNSIIFRQIETGIDSKISNSIIMNRCKIGKNAILENVILDKEVVIGEGVILKGNPQEPVIIRERCKIG